MPHFLSLAGHASVIFLEVIALVWLGQRALELVSRTRFRQELRSSGNPAAGVAVAGCYLSLFIALSGQLSGEANRKRRNLRRRRDGYVCAQCQDAEVP